MKWIWVERRVIELLHDESIAEHGGSSGLRDAGLLESALARAKNLAAYAGHDHADLAAAYAIGVSTNHPFVDGNKRSALLAAGLFLALNGYRLTASQADATLTMSSVAAGDIDDAALAAWLRKHSKPR